ncbi:hypothetical protein T4B_4204 [Trichinella pseudospiralis]|uniref:Uncharacterized protein n=2 Tax=Trichinella pseudospiralis TaxID=6337 RepID=A0A0V1IBT9_TRIPS|nr:hypothetical protein T4D_11539 [Trichinella pseudospiralis]KRZ20317.1 hypothetical protein T4B_4204 [Trichinella pseudospiralis]
MSVGVYVKVVLFTGHEKMNETWHTNTMIANGHIFTPGIGYYQLMLVSKKKVMRKKKLVNDNH